MNIFPFVQKNEETNNSPLMMELWIIREKNREKCFLSLDNLNLCPRCRRELNKAISEAKNR